MGWGLSYVVIALTDHGSNPPSSKDRCACLARRKSSRLGLSPRLYCRLLQELLFWQFPLSAFSRSQPDSKSKSLWRTKSLGCRTHMGFRALVKSPDAARIRPRSREASDQPPASLSRPSSEKNQAYEFPSSWARGVFLLPLPESPSLPARTQGVLEKDAGKKPSILADRDPLTLNSLEIFPVHKNGIRRRFWLHLTL